MKANSLIWNVFIFSDNLGKGSKKKKKLVEFCTKRLTPPLVEKNKKTKNDLRALKQILYDMGLLALVR